MGACWRRPYNNLNDIFCPFSEDHEHNWSVRIGRKKRLVLYCVLCGRERIDHSAFSYSHPDSPLPPADALHLVPPALGAGGMGRPAQNRTFQ